MKNFEGFGLNPMLAASLVRMNYAVPTPIQAQAIPPAIQGRDIMGTAQTGTGKTAAFAIPLVEALLRSPNGSALVMTPTRELGKQIMDIMHQLLGPKSPIKTAFLIGGESMGKQFSQLNRRPRLIVGTPGRINDHLERRSLSLKDTGFLVLDETDRMLDMGFSVQIDRILKYMPAKRQTLMFSATMPQNILKLSEQYLHNPERIAVGSTVTPVQNIDQDVIHLTSAEKYGELIRQLNTREGSVVIFVKTKFGTERLAKRLNGEALRADAIHGDLRQSRRDKVIRDFREKKYRILVATDVAARGLDIPHIAHVINFDLPQVPEDYIHRIGRTARAGAKGAALCLVSPEDGKKWNAIARLIGLQGKDAVTPFNPKPRNKKRGGKPFSGKPFKSGKPNFAKRKDNKNKNKKRA